MLKIGISSCMFYEDKSRSSFAPKRLNYMVEDMGAYVNRDDVLPVLIPSLTLDKLKDFINKLDGIVLHGGADIAPESYGEEPIGKWKGDRTRDLIELEIIKFAIKAKKPILGICRGFQLLNVSFGGTLYQDIHTQFKTSTQHKGTNYDQNIHPIKLKEGSFLREINKGKELATVNSIHHQGIKELSYKLEPIAWAYQDHMVEAFYAKDYPHIIGVQWHPEFDYNHKESLLDAEKIFDHFLRHCLNFCNS